MSLRIVTGDLFANKHIIFPISLYGDTIQTNFHKNLLQLESHAAVLPHCQGSLDMKYLNDSLSISSGHDPQRCYHWLVCTLYRTTEQIIDTSLVTTNLQRLQHCLDSVNEKIESDAILAAPCQDFAHSFFSDDWTVCVETLVKWCIKRNRTIKLYYSTTE